MLEKPELTFVSKLEVTNYPVLRLNKDDAIEIFNLFSKYCQRTCAMVSVKERAYEIRSESDFNINEKELDFFEISGTSPYASLILAHNRARLLISDSKDHNLIALQRDIDNILNERKSRWNIISSDILLILFACGVITGLALIAHDSKSLLGAALFVCGMILTVSWPMFRDYFTKTKRVIITLVTPKTTKITGIPYLTISVDWREIIRNISGDIFSNVLKFLIYALCGAAIAFLATQIPH